jgi:hypothetical protein
MHIDHDNITLNNESDVEQKIIMPLLGEDIYLEISSDKIFPKQYLAPTALDKTAGRAVGYYPDYTVWMRGFPVAVVEAKSPDVPSETGYREASLYARHLNQSYKTDLNPCRFLIATNGKTLLAGYWDSPPVLEVQVTNLRLGSAELESLRQHCHKGVLEEFARQCLLRVRSERTFFPYVLAGGPALLRARVPVNSFAADLSPILRLYFTSPSEENNREIIERAYVCSGEVTEYDRILEALLKERLTVQRGTVVEKLEPGRHGEQHVEKVISDFREERPSGGQLQIVQGSVGSGKSLFTRRYKEATQSPTLANVTRWAFVDFNSSPSDLSNAERWLCQVFRESFQRENPEIDFTSASVLRGIYSNKIQMRKPIYDLLAKASAEQAAIAKANDLANWQDDVEETARGIAQYVLGSRQEVLITVMDNVDRLDLKNQLTAFQLALWFMQRTSCFVILQMRDETYERYKNKPPLDTFRTGITFHISPPRFTDVVKRRLELSREYLASRAAGQQRYSIESGVRVTYKKSDLEEFLRELYVELFDRKRNISRLLEAVAGWDVRRALQIFVSIITSGHLSPTAITSTVLGGRSAGISEHNILKILMRGEYQFFSDDSGFVSNLLSFDPDWQKPDNFILVEVLYFLAINRKRKGAIGLEGYFTCRHVAQELQRLGYVPDDVLSALNVALQRQLIGADHMNFTSVSFDDSVRILASGYMHVRVLAGRLEYLYGIIPTTPILERDTAQQLTHFLDIEKTRGSIAPYQKLRAVEILHEYLSRQWQKNRTPFAALEDSGAAYVLAQIAGAINHFKNATATAPADSDPLDF